jgi:uncharacterized protein (TIGR02147 family)
MVFEHGNYRTFLKATLTDRAKGEDGYSLRGFAEKIGVSVSFLSEVLGQKKSISVELAFKIAVKLNLTETETQYLCLLVQLESEKDPSFREELSKRLAALSPTRSAHDLSVDVYKVIADWYHYAILELTYLAGFHFDAASVAKKLSITKVEAEVAIERLERLELLEKDAKGKYKKTHAYQIMQSQTPNGAMKKHHNQILDKATESLYTQKTTERVSATDILPIDSKYLPEVDRLSQEFSASVLKLSEKSKVKDNVYALSVHFFNLTHERKL